MTCQLQPDDEFPEYCLPYLKEEVRTADGRITHWVVLWGYVRSDERGDPAYVYMVATVVPAGMCRQSLRP